MNAFEALDRFWNSFQWPAYDENTVPAAPDAPALPYITYGAAKSNFDEPVALHCDLWDKGTSWTAITNKADEINREIGMGGKMLRYGSGYIWIKRGTPFMQRMPDDDPEIRRIYINIEADYITPD